MATWSIFPAEIICHILRSSSPRDVLRWRTVSKWFHAITYDTSVWRGMYANSRMPRPPGPFPFQSSAHLERALVRTEKLAQSWLTGPMRDGSCVELRVEQNPRGPTKLLCGRWLVGCEAARRFVLYNVDAGPESRRQVMWEHDSGEPVVAWDVGSVTSEEGRCAVYVLLWYNPLIPRCKLLELRTSDNSDKPYDLTVFDIPKRADRIRAHLASGSSPFLYIPGESMVFDTRTRIFYDFPEFRIALQGTKSYLDPPYDSRAPILRLVPGLVVLTRSHIIVLHDFVCCAQPFCVVTQAFTVPANGSLVKNGNGVLRLSHEGISPYGFDHVALLRNSIVDSVTGSTNVRLLVHDNSEGDHYIVCKDLTLPEPSGDDVLPITITIYEIGTSKRLREHELGATCPYYVECSDEGLLRGFYMKDDRALPHPQDYRNLKFVFDATQDECILAFGEYLSPEWDHVESPGFMADMSFDGARGRLCFIRNIDEGGDQVVVVDLE